MSKKEQEGYPLHPDTKAFLEKEIELYRNRFTSHKNYYCIRIGVRILLFFLMLFLFIPANMLVGTVLGKVQLDHSIVVAILGLWFVTYLFLSAYLLLPLFPLNGMQLEEGIKFSFSFDKQISTLKNRHLWTMGIEGYTDCLEPYPQIDLVAIVTSRALELAHNDKWKKMVDKAKKINKEPIEAFSTMLERIRQFELDRIAKEKEKEKELQRAAAQAFKNRLSNKLQELDKDGNGIVDDIEGDDAFEALLKKHEVLLVEKEKEFSQKFVHKFIRMSSYLTQQRDNIQRIFTLLSKSQNHKSLDENLELLQSEIHTYQLLLLNSINMVTLLADNKVIDFWKTYEVFDSLNVYDSNHQRQLSTKLDNIGEGLNELMGSIDRMNLSMSRQLSSLHRLTESNGASMQKQLNSVNSNLKVNNVLNAVQIYQNRKTNKRLG